MVKCAGKSPICPALEVILFDCQRFGQLCFCHFVLLTPKKLSVYWFIVMIVLEYAVGTGKVLSG